MNEDRNIRAALDRHWAASDANDFEAEHEIYHDDAVLEYPQSGERIRAGRDGLRGSDSQHCGGLCCAMTNRSFRSRS
jgi:ketosteroid isomerase-like protein